MLIFHEGLPGSGKSFASIKDHVIPALQKGRKVYAYIAGLDHDKVAQVAEITIEDCRKLLFQVTKEQVPTIYDHVENDALVVIDELQNFWPSARQKLGPEITEFITEHRHRGLDVLAMGQVLGDCHSMWKNRVDQLVHFYKRDAIGKDDEYKWSVQKRGGNGKFAEVTSGVCKYEEKYFGTYKSHTDGTANKGHYKDERANVWNSKVLKRTLPIYLVIAVIALGVVVWAFKGGIVKEEAKPKEAKSETKQEIKTATPAPAAPVAVPQAAPVKEQAAEYMPLPAADIVDHFTAKYRARLAGFIEFRGKRQGFIEWRDTDNGVREVLTLNALQGLGWLVLVSPDGQMAMLQKVDRKYYVTAWPIDNVMGTLSQQQKGQLVQSSVAAASSSPSGDQGAAHVLGGGVQVAAKE